MSSIGVKIPMVGLVAALALVLAACGDDDGGRGNDALVESIASQPGNGDAPADCDGIAHGTTQTRTRYAAATVPFGETCQSETQERTCNEGVWGAWSGTYTFTECHVDADPGDAVTILSAFFGLDNGVPGVLFGCGLVGLQDGMPIVLDQRIPLPALLDPAAFVVHRQSGAESPVACATLAPAVEPEERRTILLMGEFASAGDPPVGVEIVGSLLTDDGVDAMGAITETVIPLSDGPSIVIAELYSPSDLPTGGADECPDSTDHIIKTTWDGGVTGPQGAELDETHRLGTTVEYANGEIRVATVLADAMDGDNHVEYCMSAPGDPVAITAGAGLYEDPNNDANSLHTQAVVDADKVGP